MASRVFVGNFGSRVAARSTHSLRFAPNQHLRFSVALRAEGKRLNRGNVCDQFLGMKAQICVQLLFAGR